MAADYAKYREIIKDFIAKNPQREIYLAAGWIPNEENVTKSYLDEICPDKPLIMNTGDAHSCLLNSKALEWAGIDAEYAKKCGFDLVHVDENGEPDGYICESPAFNIIHEVPVTVEEISSLPSWTARRSTRRAGNGSFSKKYFSLLSIFLFSFRI